MIQPGYTWDDTGRRVRLPQCEALSVDSWVCAPHFIKRCQLRAYHDRRGLRVCRVHKDAPTRYRHNGNIPDWPEMAAEARRNARHRHG